MSRTEGNCQYFVRLIQEFVQIYWTKREESGKLDV